jgi:ribosomal protein L22
MADDETQEEKPRRRRRRKASDPAEPAATPPPESAAEDEAPEEDEGAAADEVQPTPADEAAEEAAEDVVLEAEAEIDQDSEPDAEGAAEDVVLEAEAEEGEGGAEVAKRPRRRRRAQAEPEEAKPRTPARPAPSRRRARRDPNLPPPIVRAQAKYVRSSARKARLVCDHIRGKTIQDARAILAHTPRAVARDWSKLLESAIANAENNHELVGEDLYIKAVHADEGPTIKRFRPRAMGRATRIRKRTSHLTILLTPKE